MPTEDATAHHAPALVEGAHAPSINIENSSSELKVQGKSKGKKKSPAEVDDDDVESGDSGIDLDKIVFAVTSNLAERLNAPMPGLVSRCLLFPSCLPLPLDLS